MTDTTGAALVNSSAQPALMPAMMMTAPVRVSAVVLVAAVKTVAASVIAKARSKENADANRRNEKHGTWRRRRRVIITRRGRAVRLNHICAGV